MADIDPTLHPIFLLQKKMLYHIKQRNIYNQQAQQAKQEGNTGEAIMFAQLAKTHNRRAKRIETFLDKRGIDVQKVKQAGVPLASEVEKFLERIQQKNAQAQQVIVETGEIQEVPDYGKY